MAPRRVPFSDAELMARGIGGARLVELEGSDHLPWVGDVSSVLSPIAEFVAEVSGRPGQRAAVPAARTRRPATGWEALTDAERRVAQLVAGGLANREVAERLYLSRYTVETHLKHVFEVRQLDLVSDQLPCGELDFVHTRLVLMHIPAGADAHPGPRAGARAAVRGAATRRHIDD
jgi:DNA-binding CsgD family transcriptional regulator